MNWLYNLIHNKCIKELSDLQGAYDTSILENNRLRDLLNKEAEKPIECKSYGQIANGDAYTLIRNSFDCYNINLSDTFFNLPDKDEAKEFTEETKVAYRKWTQENHDCDNFSFAAMGYWSQGLISHAFGIAWSQGHAFNFLIDKNKQIWIVEPQTNAYYKLEDIKENKAYYPIRLVVM